MGTTKHGEWGTPFYRYWSNLVYRLTNKKSKYYNPKRICKKWLDFSLFQLDLKDNYDYWCSYYETDRLKLVALEPDYELEVSNYEWIPSNSKNPRYVLDKKTLNLDD